MALMGQRVALTDKPLPLTGHFSDQPWVSWVLVSRYKFGAIDSTLLDMAGVEKVATLPSKVRPLGRHKRHSRRIWLTSMTFTLKTYVPRHKRHSLSIWLTSVTLY
jgi:hypothetical protein